MLASVSAAVQSEAVPNRPCRRAYDHRLRDLVCEERDPALFAQLGIPRSTAAGWIRRGSRDLATTELFAKDELALRDGTRAHLHGIINLPRPDASLAT